MRHGCRWPSCSWTIRRRFPASRHAIWAPFRWVPVLRRRLLRLKPLRLVWPLPLHLPSPTPRIRSPRSLLPPGWIGVPSGRACAAAATVRSPYTVRFPRSLTEVKHGQRQARPRDTRMYRVQAPELHNEQESTQSTRPGRTQEVLSLVPESQGPPRDPLDPFPGPITAPVEPLLEPRSHGFEWVAIFSPRRNVAVLVGRVAVRLAL